MSSIAFIDIEIDPKTSKINDIGAITSDNKTFHSPSISDFREFIKECRFICGHNIIHHDLKYLNLQDDLKVYIDTLYLSPLLFPAKPYHSLLKDDKILSEELNNPLNDSKKAKDLFYDEINAFNKLEENIKYIFYYLLNDKEEFQGFFKWINFKPESNTGNLPKVLEDKICSNVNKKKLVAENPVELAYCIALLNTGSSNSITPPWVLKNYPEVERVMYLLRNNPCLEGCSYCDQNLNVHHGLEEFFGFKEFRTYNQEPLQEKAAKAAVDGKSLLAIFPTGGGKSLTFQLPALMSGRNTKGLTVIISPLQSLMKDQVDNLEKNNIIEAVTINGMLDPIERAKSFERVEDGSASMLYISPESLRSRSIEKLLLGRNVVRFVIDEAHCFSSWGQDFRVDYLYIGDFIKALQEKKNLEHPIPVSCFTATAKLKVIEDIKAYFKEKLSLSLEIFHTNTSRSNLHFQVIPKDNDEEKYNTTRSLIEEKNCPTIIYVSRTYKAYKLAERLCNDGFRARAYHGKMDIKEKAENQNAFISGEVDIMVATSAFGMGVDKKDVGMVIHYEISDSLENYVQEAGRAGRDESISAECFILFHEEDLSKHFILLNQTKLSIKEIQQVWRAIKEITKFRQTKISNSALEIARKAGWDENVAEIETRVTTAIAALEEAGYLKRGQNMPSVFANSILSKNATEAIDKINASTKFDEKQKVKATRIIKKLFSSKSKRLSTDEVAEARVDYISDHLGIVKEEVIRIIRLLREERILADSKDLTAFIKKNESQNKSLSVLENYITLEKFLLKQLHDEETELNIKELNELAEEEGYDFTPNKFKTILNFWVIKNWVKRKFHDYNKNRVSVLCLQPTNDFSEKLEKRQQLALFIIEYLFRKSYSIDSPGEEFLIEFSVLELKEAYEKSNTLFKINISPDDIEDSLFYLSRIEAIKIEGGFLVVYNRLTIDRLEKNNKIQYKNEDYQKLEEFYSNKIQQIHIAGEYAKKMINDYKEALQFVDDYFQLNYSSFLNKYFPGSRQKDIKQNITPAKFKQLFGTLSPAQLSIIKDNSNQYIAVAAGPGSGKTRVLVHKLASLYLLEDVKHEQLLMLTFSRAAVTEFKKRLLDLIGNAANFIEIQTFHSYCFDLLGKVGSLEKSKDVIKQAVQKIQDKDIEISQITKSVLVIDEAQDMDQDEFNLLVSLMDLNEEMRVIAVGDDDQNIYEFRGSSSKFLEAFINDKNAVRHELLENYRSRKNLVEFTNTFINTISHRLKHNSIIPHQKHDGHIKIINYKSQFLSTPAVEDILNSDLSGSTAVLTKTNQEALQVTGLLLKNNIPAKLIQSNDSFNLYNLIEVREFIDLLNPDGKTRVVNKEEWKERTREFLLNHKRNDKVEILQNILHDFETTNPKIKYISDFEIFVKESRLEDFMHGNSETISVSTIHKAKGREFDNVFLVLDNFIPSSDEAKRQLYVALTRAKNQLAIHYNGTYLDNIQVGNLLKSKNGNTYSEPEQIILQLTHRDIWLDYFKNRQFEIAQLQPGVELEISSEFDLCYNSKPVVKLSTSFKNSTFNALCAKDYSLTQANVNFILYWQKEGDEEIRIVLPELWFERNQLSQKVNL